MAVQPTGTVTLLFTDIEGSTRLLQELGQERYATALDLHRRLLREAFARHDGYEVDCEGDAFFVAFSRASDAAAAAVAAQQALAETTWPGGLELRVRMGIHTGEPLVVPPKYVGIDVHHAARIMAAGHGGQVLVSESTYRMLESGAARDLGSHRLKDLLQPIELYQLEIEGALLDFPALNTLGNRPTNLPVQPNALFGREDEIAEVVSLLRGGAVRLVTLTSSGGMGKTRLALQAAAELVDDFASGVFFVALAPVSDPTGVLPAIARTLAVREVAGEELGRTLTTYLEQRNLLLVLDNFEQVIDAAPEVNQLLARCRTLSVLATSRERLRVNGEHVYRVPPLRLVEADSGFEALQANAAIALFAARANAAAGSFALTAGNAAVVAAICARLDGMPLAIELAAARASVFPPEALLRRLDHRLKLLTGGARDAEDRQRTLAKTIEWSYELLTPAEQALFARVSVFVDGCRIEAAEAVCDPERSIGIDVLDGLASLVEKNLLRQRPDDDGEPRYWMLETIREYGLLVLAESGLETELRHRHAGYFVEASAAVKAGLRDREQARWVRLADADHDNFRAALAWTIDSDEAELAIRVVDGLWMFWLLQGHLREGVRWGEAALEIAGDASERARADGAATVGELLRYLGEDERAAAYKEEALALFRELKDLREIAATLHDLGEIRFRQGAYAQARQLHEESLALREEIGDERGIAHALSGLVDLLIAEGDFENATESSERILATGRAGQEPRFIIAGLQSLGEIAHRQNDLEHAETCFREGLEVANESQSLLDTGFFLSALARIQLSRGNALAAARIWGTVEALRSATGLSLWHPDDERCLGEARAKADPTSFAEALQEGRRETVEQAVAQILAAEPVAASNASDANDRLVDA